MNRATPEKRAEQNKLAADVEAFIAGGGEIKELPGFGLRPGITDYSPLIFAHNTIGHKNGISDEIEEGINRDLIAGMGTTAVGRKWGVGSSAVTKRKDRLTARGMM